MHWQTHDGMCDRCSLILLSSPHLLAVKARLIAHALIGFQKCFIRIQNKTSAIRFAARGCTLWQLSSTVRLPYSEGLCPSVNACSDRLYFSVHVEFNDVGRCTFSVLICFLLIWWWWWLQKPYFHRSCLARSSPFRIRSADRQCHQTKNCSVSSSEIMAGCPANLNLGGAEIRGDLDERNPPIFLPNQPPDSSLLALDIGGSCNWFLGMLWYLNFRS